MSAQPDDGPSVAACEDRREGRALLAAYVIVFGAAFFPVILAALAGLVIMAVRLVTG